MALLRNFYIIIRVTYPSTRSFVSHLDKCILWKNVIQQTLEMKKINLSIPTRKYRYSYLFIFSKISIRVKNGMITLYYILCSQVCVISTLKRNNLMREEKSCV